MGNSDKTRQAGLACPYCTKEIPPGVSSCPSCGVSYGSETIQLVRSFVTEEVLGTPGNKDRSEISSKKYKVVYQTLEAFTNSYLSTIGNGGIFIKTDRTLEKGSQFYLKLFIPDGAKELEVLCEVVWACVPESPEEKSRLSPGMGVRFLNLSREGKVRIERILKKKGLRA